MLWFVCERAHAPVEHGTLSFDRREQRWLFPHADPRVQRLAACYLETYSVRQKENRSLDHERAAS